MARLLLIAGKDKYNDLIWNTLKIEQNMTYTMNICQFQIRHYQPTEGEEVIIEDTEIGRLFAGIITKVELARPFPTNQIVKVWQVDCNDYTELVDRKLVVEAYEDASASSIFLDLAIKYCSDFSLDGIKEGAPIIESTGAEFEYKRPSECFKWLCDYCGWQWTVDYYKGLHFFSAEELIQPAPMVLRPDSNFQFGKHSINVQGLRNRVYVRGGTMLSDPQLVQWKADGIQRIWVLPWPPHEINFKVAEVSKTVGVENLHEEINFEYMMNFQEKYIRCSEHTSTPQAGATMALIAKQDIPVISMVEDYESQREVAKIQGGDGVHEHVISDNTLLSIAAAEAAGMADLREHANPKVRGDFKTEYIGQKIIEYGPGPSTLMKGNMQAGYFGEVAMSELITGDALADLIDLTAGVSQYSGTAGWLKFAYQGKIQYVAKKPLRYGLSWDEINAVNAVYGNKIIRIDDLDCKVRLMHGANQDPVSAPYGEINYYSEWNKLMLPILTYAETGSWTMPQCIESDLPYWGVDFSDTDLGVLFTPGSSSWCQETYEHEWAGNIISERIYRGFEGADCSGSNSPDNDSSYYGWRPVLELVPEDSSAHTWQPGQIADIYLPDHGAVGNYLIQRVTITASTPQLWSFHIEYGGRLLGIADFLQALVSSHQKRRTVEPTKSVQKYVYGEEHIEITDQLTTLPRALPYTCGDVDAICGMTLVSDGGVGFLAKRTASRADGQS